LFEGWAVPIRLLLAENSGVFGPEELHDIAKAFEAVLKDMGLTDRKGPVTITLAKLMIELANRQAEAVYCRLSTRPRPEGNEAEGAAELSPFPFRWLTAHLNGIRSSALRPSKFRRLRTPP
jgi:hypothetical protein